MSNQPIILPAIVKYEAREPKQTTRGPRINVKVTLEDGTEAQIWGDPNSPIADWKRGQRVNVRKNGQYFDPAPGTPDAGTAQNTPQAPQKPQADVSSPEAVEALQKRSATLTGLYLDIYARLIEGDPEKPFASGISKEDLSSAAATIFIQVCRG
jgi:hypothetical protein